MWMATLCRGETLIGNPRSVWYVEDEEPKSWLPRHSSLGAAGHDGIISTRTCVHSCVAPPRLASNSPCGLVWVSPGKFLNSCSTSGRSTKLIHGGIRYLETAFKKLDIESYYLVEEALEERAYMLQV